MKKFVFASVAMVLTFSLAGCASGPRTYGNVEDLKGAYVAAGGKCDTSTKVDTSAFTADNADLEGLAGVSCPNDIGMFVFPSNKARDYFVDLVNTAASASKTAVPMVIGEKWMVAGVTFDSKKFAEPLGGTARN
jgi:hypothetical protein